jgi:hypothetical protein
VILNEGTDDGAVHVKLCFVTESDDHNLSLNV